MSKTSRISSSAEARVRAFLTAFSREAPHIREDIVNNLPAYNMLLDLEAESFEEIALRQLSRERGEIYDETNLPVPECPRCQTGASAKRKEGFTFLCKSCGHTYVANHNSISSGTKVSALTWMKMLHCLLENMSITRSCKYCGITETTYYKIRNRILYAMSIALEDVKLYGVVEVDNSFVRASYKGVNLQEEEEFPEDSIFSSPTQKPRDGKKRGGAFSNSSKNANSICIFTAIDDRGHVLVRYAGFGNTCFSVLKNHVPSEKFLLSVPNQDPFALTKKGTSEAKSQPNEPSVMVADKEGAIKKYAVEHLGIEFESHVYRRDGVQLRQSASAHNIQRVNALHRRMKDFLRKCGYVSTKYLPGMLTLFEWIENTGGSKAAIENLFNIIAKPNLGKPPQFYQSMFSVPNYLVEWLEGDHPLRKIPYNKLLAYYLYDQLRNKESCPDITITMEQIEDQTGYTAPTIRRSYRELKKAGYHDMVLTFFKKKEGLGSKGSKRGINAPKSINPIVLAIFDEYASLRSLPARERPTLEKFLSEKNKQYGTNFKRTNMLAKFKLIVESGVRDALPTFKPPEKTAHGYNPDKALEILKEYDQIVLSYRERGEKPPRVQEICLELSKRWGLSISTILSFVSDGRQMRRNQRKENAE